MGEFALLYILIFPITYFLIALVLSVKHLKNMKTLKRYIKNRTIKAEFYQNYTDGIWRLTKTMTRHKRLINRSFPILLICHILIGMYYTHTIYNAYTYKQFLYPIIFSGFFYCVVRGIHYYKHPIGLDLGFELPASFKR